MNAIVTASSPVQPESSLDERDRLNEVIDDERREVNLGGVRESLVGSRLGYQLSSHAHVRRLGTVVIGGHFELQATPCLQRRPDIAFVSAERWPLDRSILDIDDNAWKLVPDLVIEVNSPTDTANVNLRRVRDFCAAGCRQVWFVYSEFREIQVFDTRHSSRSFTRGDTLTGDPVIPGFTLAIDDFFGPEPPTTTTP